MMIKPTAEMSVNESRAAIRTDDPFEQLYRDTSADLYAYLAFMVKDRSLAEELTAQAYEKAFRKIGRYSASRGDLKAWLFRLARNNAIDHLRRAKRESEIVMQLEVRHHEDAAVDERLAIADAMRCLQPRDRELVALKFFAGLDNESIGRAVGATASAVGTRLHRAIQNMRKAMEASDAS